MPSAVSAAKRPLRYVNVPSVIANKMNPAATSGRVSSMLALVRTWSTRYPIKKKVPVRAAVEIAKLPIAPA